MNIYKLKFINYYLGAKGLQQMDLIYVAQIVFILFTQ
jgi:hypothetical protein